MDTSFLLQFWRPPALFPWPYWIPLQRRRIAVTLICSRQGISLFSRKNKLLLANLSLHSSIPAQLSEPLLRCLTWLFLITFRNITIHFMEKPTCYNQISKIGTVLVFNKLCCNVGMVMMTHSLHGKAYMFQSNFKDGMVMVFVRLVSNGGVMMFIQHGFTQLSFHLFI